MIMYQISFPLTLCQLATLATHRSGPGSQNKTIQNHYYFAATRLFIKDLIILIRVAFGSWSLTYLIQNYLTVIKSKLALL